MPIYPTNKKKDGRQQYRVRVNYTDSTGRHLQKEQCCYGYQEALALEHKMLLKYSASSAERSEMLLRDFYEEYKSYKVNEIRETSYAKMVGILDRHVLPYLGDLPLNRLDEKALAQWKISICDLGLSVSTNQRIYGELCGLLNFAFKMKLIPEKSTNLIENFRDTNFAAPTVDRLHYYTSEQFLQFSAAADSCVTNYYERSVYMFFMIAYFTGMRKGEIHALSWNDIDGNIIHVQRSISQKIKGKPYVETPPKNRSSIRSLQIPLPLQQLLVQYKAMQQLHYGKKWRKDFRVCYGERCISDTSISNYNIKWSRLAELPTIRIHDYRHSHASLLANEGINIQEIARRLGHSNVQVTWSRYAHLYPREEERAVTVLNRIDISSIHELSTKKL